MAIDLAFGAREVALLIDLYELTMAASYFASGYNDTATFTLMTRRLPPRRGFLVAAGIDRLIEAIEDFRFDQPALDYLDSLKLFAPDFLVFLGALRFTGDVFALPEGTIFFADEPILEVRAPLIEAQLLETLAINQVGIASLTASKAARCVLAGNGRRQVDFGLRRSHGTDAGLIAARSSYLAGFAGTSNVLAGMRYGIPLYGTMAHSYVMAHERERDAFENYTRLFPSLSTLLVDTYDTIKGVENAVAVAREMKEKGFKLQAIRIDSGDLHDLSVRARRILDRNALTEVSIFASGNLNEYRIQELVRMASPIDAFGVGTEMAVSADAPALDIAYKLAEYKDLPRLKTSPDKLSLPGRKQVFRAFNAAGGFAGDLVGLADETAATVKREFKPAPAEVTALLEPQLLGGHPIKPRPTLEQSRERLAVVLGKLEPRYKDLDRSSTFPVKHTAALKAMLIDEKVRAGRRQS